MKIKNYYILGIGLIIGVFVGRYIFRPNPEVKVKEVIKTVEIFKEKKTEDKRTKTVITERKDKEGNIIKETVITEDTKSEVVVNKDTKIDVISEKTSKSGQKITLGLLGIADTNKISNKIEYGATATVPLMGSTGLQGIITTDKKVGLGISISF